MYHISMKKYIIMAYILNIYRIRYVANIFNKIYPKMSSKIYRYNSFALSR